MFRLVSTAFVLASAFIITFWDFMDRSIPAERLDQVIGQNQGQHLRQDPTDCAENQESDVWPENAIPGIHCDNFDEAVAGATCFNCGLLGQFITTYVPFGVGPEMVEGPDELCDLDLHIGICKDLNGDGSYTCVPNDDVRDGTCSGMVTDYLYQQTEDPGGGSS